MKRVLTIAIFLLVLTAACNQTPTSGSIAPECSSNFRSAPHPFVVTATQNELNAIQDETQLVDTCQFQGIIYHLGRANGLEFVYFLTGVGPDNASAAVESTLSNFNTMILVLSGSSGALAPDLEVGDTVIALRWLEYGTENDSQVNTDLISVASIINTVDIDGLEDVEVQFVELGVTTDYFVENGTDVYNKTQAAIVDMESFYMSEIARAYNTPFISIRTIANYADGNEDTTDFPKARLANARTTKLFLLLYLFQ